MILSPEEMSWSHLDVWIARVESEVVGCPPPHGSKNGNGEDTWKPGQGTVPGREGCSSVRKKQPPLLLSSPFSIPKHELATIPCQGRQTDHRVPGEDSEPTNYTMKT